MFGKAKDLAKMLQNAKALQSNMEAAKQKLANTTFSANANGVEISLSGLYRILELKIPEAISAKEAEAAIITAYNDCLSQIESASEQQIQSLSKDFNIQDLLDDK